jgi:glyoxylase-like metal-dependent hydrolase (beta-lactamase superfamily II)
MDKHNNGNMANSCFVNMGSSYLVIDSGPTYKYAQQAYKKMVQISSLPVSYVVDTHIHDDHWLGNGYYQEIGAILIGSPAFTSLSSDDITRMQKRISKEAYQGTEQVFPTLFVDDTKILDFNGKKVYIIAVNHKAHTDSDLLVYIPSQKIVFVGDIIFNERLPSLRDGDINGWLKTIEKIKKMDVEHIIGGHGVEVSRKSLDFTYSYLKELKQKVSSLMEEGYDIGDVVDMVKMKKYEKINFYDSMHRQNVEVVYRMLEWSDEED